LKEWGDEIKKQFVKPLVQASVTGKELTIELKQETLINYIILQEEISLGERVRQYIIEAYINDQGHELARGECIGHKRIQKIDPIMVSQIRLRVLESLESPQIKTFSVYWIEGAK
jgi:hypothetical protein